MRPPVIFISHGAPTVALEDHGDYARALRRFGKTVAAPRAIVVMSAHWEAGGPARVSTAAHPRVVHDFGGFPEPLYSMTYPAAGDPALAAEILSHLQQDGIPAVGDADRGWDHGVWIPCRLMFPEAAIPVVEISLPRPSSPRDLVRLGRALAPLRDDRVLLMGSGGIVHNLRRIRLDSRDAPAEAWAVEFDGWFKERLERRDLEAILSYRSIAPHAELAAPTPEHFDPVFFALGASNAEDPVVHLYEGILYGNLSMRSFAC